MIRRSLVPLALVAGLSLVAGACGAQGAEDAAENDQETTETTAAQGGGSDGGEGKFGDLESPCGEGEATVAADEAGRGTDKLYVGVANDRTSPFRQGLNKELWDMAQAFAGWCNAQGGISGLEIELVDIDGKVLEVEAAMATACTDVFAMVGGGFVQDNLMFNGKDGADFHKCKLIAVPGWAVSTEFAEADGQVQPLPNPAYVKTNSWFPAMVKLYPDEMKNLAAVYGNIPSIVTNKDQNLGMIRATEGYDKITEISYDAIGNQDWGLVAQQVKDAGAGAVMFVGEPGNYSKMSQALKDQGFEGVVFAEANHYDQLLLDSSGPAAVEGNISRIGTHPYEEADRWPATKQMLDIFEEYGPADGKLASLSTQSFSAWLLFATAAKACAAEGEITRDCVLSEAKSNQTWTGGGLHATGSPKDNGPAECSMLMQVQDGKWTRLFPELDSEDDNGEGFFCADPLTIEIEGDFGEGVADPSRG